MENLEISIGSKKAPVKINLNEFKGRKLLDIRKYYLSQDELIPTKKGISLNAIQFGEILQAISENNEIISNHFEISQEELEIEIETKQTLGRSFSLTIENDDQKLVVNPNFENQLENISIDDFSKILITLYKSITDVIEDDDDVNRILDRLDHHLKRTKW